MNVLILAGAHPPGRVYAESRHASGLARALAAAGHRVRVLSADACPHGERAGGNGPAVERTGGTWPFYHYEQDSDAVLGALGLLGRGLAGILPHRRPDLVICYGWARALAGFALRERTGTPAVVYLHGTARGREGGAMDDAARYRTEMEGWAAEAADAVICPSEAARADVIEHCGVAREKVHAVPAACDWTRLDPGRTDLGDFRALLAEPEELLVLFAGELARDNGPGALLEAIPGVLEAGVPMRCVLAGDGGQAEELMSSAVEAGVAEQCLFAGHVSDQVLSSFYAVADVLAAPAAYSPSATSAVEAMSLGTPAVGSDTGALGALIADGRNGLKVHPQDPDALGAALAWLGTHRDRLDEMAEAARASADGAHSWDKSAAVVMELADRLPRAAGPTGPSGGG